MFPKVPVRKEKAMRESDRITIRKMFYAERKELTDKNFLKNIP